VMNQFTEQFSVEQLAQKVHEAAKTKGLRTEIAHLDNPRVEKENHYYNAQHTKLLDLGLKPHLLSDSLLDSLLSIAIKYRDNISREMIAPRVNWRHTKSERVAMGGAAAEERQELHPAVEAVAGKLARA